jgi:hypothetical protein
MKVNNQIFVSDTFTISSPVNAAMGFLCTDSLLVHWKKGESGTYTLYALGEKYLEPLRNFTDTLALLNKMKLGSRYLAVASKLSENKTGLKGYTFNYETQGIGCFVQHFLADATNDHQYVTISLQLGTAFGVKAVEIQKRNASGFKTIANMGNISGLNFIINDSSAHQGLNIYRARIERDNGSFVLSQEETVFHYGASGNVVFPNPLPVGHLLNVLSEDTDDSNIFIYTMDGRMLKTKILSASNEQVRLDLPRGIYLIHITKKGKHGVIQKLVIR